MAFLASLARLDLPALWVSVERVVSLVRGVSRAHLVPRVVVAPLVLLEGKELVVSLARLVRRVSLARLASVVLVAVVVLKVFWASKASVVTLASLASLAVMAHTASVVCVATLVSLELVVLVVPREPLVLASQVPLVDLDLVVFLVCKAQVAGRVALAAMASMGTVARRARMVRMVRMASMARLARRDLQVSLARRAPRVTAANLSCRFTLLRSRHMLI